MKLLTATALGLLALSLGACASPNNLQLLRQLGEYGCGGSLDVRSQGATGQLGGGASASVEFHGTCPSRPAPPAADPPAADPPT